MISMIFDENSDHDWINYDVITVTIFLTLIVFDPQTKQEVFGLEIKYKNKGN